MMREYLLLHTLALAAGTVLDIFIGDPHYLPHPIRLIGRLIEALERKLYKSPERSGLIRGAVLWLITFSVTVLSSAALLISAYKLSRCFGALVEMVMTYYILAAGSLRDESMKVYDSLETGDIESARANLSMIVGRDTAVLDEDGISRAAVETVAENSSDGVIAPFLYTAFLGPVGGFAYKAVNTMDSMIGYRNGRYEYFGKFAARADDVFNFIPSRASAVLMASSASVLGLFSGRFNGRRSFAVWWRDRYKHKSPNSAQTESACAGALGIRLGGPGRYGGVIVDKPYIGDNTRNVCKGDIKSSVALMFATHCLCAVIVLSILVFCSIT